MVDKNWQLVGSEDHLHDLPDQQLIESLNTHLDFVRTNGEDRSLWSYPSSLAIQAELDRRSKPDILIQDFIWRHRDGS